MPESELFVAVAVTVDGKHVDTEYYGPGYELEREAFEIGVATVALAVRPTPVGYTTQFHNHNTEVACADCAALFPARTWTNAV